MSTLAQFSLLASVIGFSQPTDYMIIVRVNADGSVTRSSKPFTAESKRFAGKQLKYIATLLETIPVTKEFMIRGRKVVMEESGNQLSKIPDNVWQEFQSTDYSKLVNDLATMEGVTISPNGDIKVDLVKHPTAPISGLMLWNTYKRGSFYSLPLPKGCGYIDSTGVERFSINVFVPVARCASIANVWTAIKYALEAANAPVAKICEYYGVPEATEDDGDLGSTDPIVEIPPLDTTAPAAV